MSINSQMHHLGQATRLERILSALRSDANREAESGVWLHCKSDRMPTGHCARRSEIFITASLARYIWLEAPPLAFL